MTAPATGLEPSTPLVIRATSATERAAFRRCRRQWFLTVAHRLESVEGNPNFWFGELVHTALQAYYEGQQDGLPHEERVAPALAAYERAYGESTGRIAAELGWLWPSVRELYRATGDLGAGMLRGYLEREREHPLFDEVLQVERRLSVPIRSPGGSVVGSLKVRADAVGTRGGRLAVADHKTASSRASSQMLDIDDQLTAEVYAVWKSGAGFPEEALYNALLKRVPAPPRQIKGTKAEPVKLSQDKDQATTFALYVAEIRRLGLEVSAYSKILGVLREAEDEGQSSFFYREGVFRTPGQMAQFEANLREEFRDMRAVGRHPERAYPSPSLFNCPGCPVKDVCLAMMDGSDPSVMIQAKFHVAEPRY